jgi:hypothetical protein
VSQPQVHDRRSLALLASIAFAALLALAAAWISALARVPQQRAAVERLLRAQTGLDVSYGRLVVRLGFYGPEAEFGNIEMRRPGLATGAPLLRAPRMVARFESWRLLRGGQLRPGRVLVTGAEVDLRQLADLRRDGRTTAPATGAAAATAASTTRRGRAREPVPMRPPPPPPPGADDSPLATLEKQLPTLLAGIPEGSLEFEAVTLAWTDPQRRTEPLQLRAPRLHASRRIDGAQLSGTLLLPARFGRTLFVTMQLREPGGAGGFDGRLRVSGRGLVLASWRESGLLPRELVGGTGDLSIAVQLRRGRVQQAEGDLRLAGLGFVAPGPVVARRFGVAAAGFDFARLPDGGQRWRLRDVELQPVGTSAAPFAERGSLEFLRGVGGRAGALSLRRLPVEALALLGAAAARDDRATSLPALRVTAGEVVELESRWASAAGAAATRGRLQGLVVGSVDGRWHAEALAVQLEGDGAHWRARLEGRDAALRLPGLESATQPVRASLSGELEFAAAQRGWSLALPALAVRFVDGPALQLRGSAGRDVDGREASRFEALLAEPLPRTAMALPQAVLGDALPPQFWAAFASGRLEAARVEFVDAAPGRATLALREVDLAGDGARPAASGVALDLEWDGRRFSGRLAGGRVGRLQLEGGRLDWSAGRGDEPSRRGAGLDVEARLAGRLEDALRMLPPDAVPAELAAGIAGRARVTARLRSARGAGGAVPPRPAYEIDVEEGRWQPLAAFAPLLALQGRLSADAEGLRGGRLDGRWLGGPVQLRLGPGGPGGEAPRIVASGRLARAALAREWAWLGLLPQEEARGDLDWSAELRRDRDDLPAPRGVARRAVRRPAAAAAAPDAAADAAPDGPAPWRMRVELAAAARAELRWVPDGGPAGWRLDRGVVRLGDDAALAGIPGALVVGGRVGRLDLGGLAAALARVAGGTGWQRPLVGEVMVADVALGAVSLGAARLGLAGSRESTAVDLQGEALAGELRQVHAEPARLQLRLARLRLPADAPLERVADAFLAARTTLQLQVADLRRGDRPLGELVATLEADGMALATRDLTLRRGARRLAASGRCERATLACSAEFTLADADLAELLRDLGHAPSLRGGDVAALGRIGWSMQPGAGFAATLQGELEFGARLEGRVPAADLPAGAAPVSEPVRESGTGLVALPVAAAVAGAPTLAPPTWPLLAPVLSTVAGQRAALAARLAAAAALAAPPGESRSGAAALAGPAADPSSLEPALELQRLDLRLALRDGVATIGRYEALGREARLSVGGRFDFRRGELEQQAEWYWIAPGVAGAVDRLDPRSPLAAGLRSLRELLGARRNERAAASRDTTEAGARDGVVERFTLSGPLQQPRLERSTLLDSPR